MFYFLHLFLLSLGFGAVGWFFAALHAKVLVWLCLYGLVLYLVRTQQGGIIVAHGWVAMAIAISAVKRTWPTVWAAHIPYHQPKIWALILLLIWGIAIGLVHLLAASPVMTEQYLANGLNPVNPPRLSSSRPRSHPPTPSVIAMVTGWVGLAIALGASMYCIGHVNSAL